MKPEIGNNDEFSKSKKLSFETLQLLAKISAKLQSEGFALGTLIGYTITPEMGPNRGIPTDITPEIFLADPKSRGDLIAAAENFILRVKAMGASTPPSPISKKEAPKDTFFD